MKEENPFTEHIRIFFLVLLPVGIIFSFFCNPLWSYLLLNYIRNDIGRPVSRTICMAAAKVDFSGRDNKYISRADLKEIKKELRPGDIIFRRNEDQLSNIAISGFWTHSGIYIGGRDEINEFFGDLVVLKGKRPSEYIEQKYPVVYRRLVFRRHLIIEAVGEGVTVSPIDHFANADYFSAIRPEIDKEALFRVILAAFDNYGKPYDFLFDFQNDDSFFCSEFVYKSFLKAGRGVHFINPPADGEPFITPNDLALQATDPSSVFRFVVFYCTDGYRKKAYKKNKEEFRIYAMN